MTTPPSLQIMEWSTVKTSPQAHVEGISSIGQSQRNLIGSELPFIQVKTQFLKGEDDLFSAAKSSARLALQGAISLMHSVLSSGSFDLSLVTACCADFTRKSSGSSCD